jgi:methyltransferase family protein
MHPAEARQLARRSRQIHGWFTPEAAALFALLDHVQRECGTHGDLFEIGTHHGKSAVLLCAMSRPSETVGVCDLFGDQALNVSASGSGDRAVFDRNVQDVIPGFARLRVFEQSSAQLSAEEVGSGQRFFHVDGGHLLEEALGDLRLGAAVLQEQGVIVVDDPFRPEWPGVTEAILRFLAEEPAFMPLVMGFNKLVLVRGDARAPYDEALASPELVWSYFDRRVYASKTLPLAGQPVTIFSIPTARQVPGLDPAAARIRNLASSAKRRLSAVSVRSRRTAA